MSKSKLAWIESSGFAAGLLVLAILLGGSIATFSVSTACWGSLDDGVVFQGTQGPVEECFVPQFGRIMYAYLLHNWLVGRAAGFDPSGWYLVQSIELLFSMVFLALSAWLATRRFSVAAFVAFLFASTAPLAENFFTVGKAEPKLAFSISLLVLMSTWYFTRRGAGSGLKKFVFWGVFFMLGLMTPFFKETGIVVVPWLLVVAIALPFQVRGRTGGKLKRWVGFLVGQAIVIGLVFLMAKLAAVKAFAGRDYTTFKSSLAVCRSHLLFYWKQTPDVIVLFLVVFVFLAVLIKRRVSADPTVMSDERIPLALGLWVSSALYIAVLVVWRLTMPYYMLPVSVMLIASLGLVMKHHLSGTKVAMLVLLLTRFHTLPYNYYVAFAQRAHDWQESKAVEAVIAAKPGHSRIFDTATFSFCEPPIQRNILLKWAGADRVRYVGVGEAFSEAPAAWREAFGAGNIKWKKPVPKSGDYFLCSKINWPFSIQVRGVGSGKTSFGPAEFDQHVADIESRFGVELGSPLIQRANTTVLKPWSLKADRLAIETRLYRVLSVVAGSGLTETGPVEE